MAAIARYCRFVLAYNLAVILWGAIVRASGSGAGCGNHWPSCNGEVVPLGRSAATWIEYSHRVSSGLVLVLAVGLLVWARRAAPPGHLLRRAALLAVAFTLSEAAVGAGLVLFKLVAHDDSLARALVITTHLLNTLLLLASLTLATWAAGGLGGPPVAARRAGASPGLGWPLAAALLATLALGATGAVAALGDTLFPAASLRQGFAQDLSPASHVLLRLRTVHPLLALAVAAYLLWLSGRVTGVVPAVRRWAHRLRLLVFLQVTVGVLSIGLLAPLWLQLTHLLVADLLWIALVVLALEALQDLPVEIAPAAVRAAATPASGVSPATGRG